MNTQVHSGAYGALTRPLGGEILLIRKSRGPYIGLLDLPGGRIEPGESPEDAVRREFAEETGLDIHVESRLGDFDRTVNYSPPGGDGQVSLHHIGVIFRVVLAKPDQDVKSGPDGQDSLGTQWVTIDSLQENSISPLVSRALALLARSPVPGMPSVEVGRRTGQSRIRRWVSSREGLYTILWATSAVAWWVTCIASRRQHGTVSAIRYVGVAMSLVTSLTATTKFPAPVLLTFPLLAVFSVSAPPAVGYGGQIFLFALRTTLILTIIAGVLSHRMTKHSLPKRLIRPLVLGHLVLVLAILAGTQSFRLLASVQHRGRAISVHTLTVQPRKPATDAYFDAVVSCPLVEEFAAFVATEAGYLHEIDLASGRIARRITLPRPEPAEVGLPYLVKCPEYASASLTGRAAITRLSAERLSVVYRFHVGTGTDLGWGISPESWRIDVEVDLAKGEVAEWALVEGYVPDELDEFKCSVGNCEVYVGNGDLSVTGPDVSTTVYTKGQVRWVRSAGDHAVAATTGGRVYVITVPPPGD